MTEEQKNELKEKGRRFFDDNLGGLKDLFGTKANAATAGGYGQNGSQGL